MLRNMKKKCSNDRGLNTEEVGGKRLIGWREWVALPDFDTPPIKAKIDTGARTSALHAFRIKPFWKDAAPYVEFYIHPEQHRRKPEIRCEAPLLEQREITSSNGQKEIRYVIETNADIGGEVFNIELTLTNRDELGFRMLIGRQAVRGHFIIDPGRSYCAASPR
ncbi:MAG: RimK/LysX family protein [Parvibaculaceae bacterium]|nr:RimK/LysX family protein [Parvibaculaceae bacterium]